MWEVWYSFEVATCVARAHGDRGHVDGTLATTVTDRWGLQNILLRVSDNYLYGRVEL
jgi:hypothetical protein